MALPDFIKSLFEKSPENQGQSESFLPAAVEKFLKLESAGGILLMLSALVAMALANSPLSFLYDAFLDTPVEIRIGNFSIAKPLLLWINDGLMAIFFFLVGLEIKREVLEGELSSPSQVILPGVAALGGMLVPALIYASLNGSDASAIKGWAIPTATDIAFALGILTLFGRAVPTSLKVFLLTLAIIDDLGAIIIIALFYSGNVSMLSLVFSLIFLAILIGMNRRGINRTGPYIFIGILLWTCVLKSGIHATLAGILAAWTVPMQSATGKNHSPLRELEHSLHSWVAYGILPLFAFANSGLALDRVSLADLTGPVPMGIALGLVLGKPVGILGFSWLAVKLGGIRLPDTLRWPELFGVSVLCGVGFTMSLFIGSLAFEQGGPDYAADDKIGILLGSLCSGLAGFMILKRVLKQRPLP
ncbi:MAG: Na+/H+ antiporter NhaA [Nitrospinae bacterium CG11_big_fil_rev_8_21_14_0_20_56_8]|nr:MAG: Na+/H+ antiporter NhaA [Nitrospinae bacterium CG11_big_fil_rev_8_21_14_0_20_56_8]